MASPALKQLSIENTPKTKEATQAMASIANARNAINAGATPTEARKGLTTPRITPESLQPTPEVKVAPPPIPVQGPALEAGITEQADQFTQKVVDDRKQRETPFRSSLMTYLEAQKNAQTQSSLEATQYAQAGGVNDITTELNDINNQIRVEQRALENARRRVTESGGGLAAGAAAEVANLERVSLQKQADLSIIQMAVQGRYDSAREIADRAVKAQMEQQNQLLDVLKFNYTENKELFTTAEQREFDTLLANRNREIQAEEDRIKEIKSFALKALEAGASVSEAKQMMGAKTLDEAMSIGGSYFRPKPTGGGVSTPTIKTINGVDYQWNPTTGQWEVPSVGGTSSVTNAQNQFAKYDELLADIEDAKTLADNGAVGAGTIERAVKGAFTSNADFNQVANIADTIKANLLTLSVDKNIKQFFGPNMSNRDTQLMTAAAGTLDSERQTPAQFKQDLADAADLIKRARKAVEGATVQTVWGIPSLAPNETLEFDPTTGQAIIITD